MRNRHPLARTLAEMAAAQRQHEREAMTPAEIGARMRKVAHEALDHRGEVTRDDFLRANLPAEAIETRARAIILEVVDERGHGGVMA